MLSFILILYKFDNSYICPLDKSVMSRHKLNTMFATLGQIAAEILYSKRIYSANGISRSFFPHISAFSRRTKMHLNGMLLIGTEFFKVIVPL